MCRVTIISWGQTAGVRMSQVTLPWSVSEQSICRSISAGHGSTHYAPLRPQRTCAGVLLSIDGMHAFTTTTTLPRRHVHHTHHISSFFLVSGPDPVEPR